VKEVVLSRDGLEVARTATDGAGRLRLVAPPPGAYRLRVEALGFDGWERPLRLRGGAAAEVAAELEALPADLHRENARAGVRVPAVGTALLEASRSSCASVGV
jgi:hypothetical protein